MTELDIIQSGEVLDELEFRALHANEHHRGVERSLGNALDHAFEAGDHLNAAKAEVVKKRGDGSWEPWLEENFEGSFSTARNYMRIARNRRELEQQGRVVRGIGEALRALTPPKDEERKETKRSKTETLEIVTAGGEVIQASTPEELAERVAEHVSSIERKLDSEISSINRERQDLRRELRHEHEALLDRTRNLDKQFAAEIARTKARYGDEEKPSFLEISDEDWANAFAEAKSARVMQVAKNLNEIYAGWPRWMNEYLPGEAAAAIEDLDHAPALTEALRYITNWLGRVIEEVEATTIEGR